MNRNIEQILDDFVIEFKQKLLQEDNNKDLLFYDYAWKWFEVYKLPREKNTQAMYRNIIRVHLSFLKDVKICDIRQSHFQEAINRNITQPRTANLVYLTFKQILQAAARDRLISRGIIDDMISSVVLPKIIKKEKRPLSDPERQAVKKVLHDRSMSDMKTVFLSLLYYCGIRKGEALALCPEDFNFEDNTVKIHKTVIFLSSSGSEVKNCPKSDHGFRTIPLPADCIDQIKEYVCSCNGFLFHGQGVVLANANFYRRLWDSILYNLNVAAGYDPFHDKEKPINGLTAHIFRHDFCTQLCYQVPDISTKMIAYLLGDSEKMVLEVYSHIVLEKENVIESLEAARSLDIKK